MLSNRDPIPELENLIAYGVQAAKDDDLVSRFGHLNTQIQQPPTSDDVNWLGIYRSALKLADRIRPIRTKDMSDPGLSVHQRAIIEKQLGEVCVQARTVLVRWKQRLDQDITASLEQKLKQKMDSLEFAVVLNDGQIVASFSSDVRDDLLLWMKERADVFASHFYESMELKLAETYREHLLPTRRYVSQFGLRRPKIIRCLRTEPEFTFPPTMRFDAQHSASSSFKDFLLERLLAREQSAFLRKACLEKWYQYGQMQIAELKVQMHNCLLEFEQRLIPLLEDWFESTKARLDTIREPQDDRNESSRPLTVGGMLEAHYSRFDGED